MSRLIWTADWHLRNQQPKVSNDKDWYQVQKQMIDKIVDICIERNCDLYNGGDLYHSVRDTTFSLVFLVQIASKRLFDHGLTFYLMCGNHDLYGHSTNELGKSAIGVTLNSPNICHMRESEIGCGNFDEETPNQELIAKHILCFPDEESIPPNVNGTTPRELLKEYDKARYIFLGDYHHSFHYEHKGRHVINPGCTTIQVADMLDYETGVYYVDTDKDIVEWIPLNIPQSFYDKIEIVPDSDLEEFANSIELKNVTFDFDTNINNALQSQPENIQKKVKNWQGY